jgi:CMP-N-acetylneuraminic acid synthetase
MAKVSVVVTAHNYGKYLPKCIESILDQNYQDYELIVVNDGSTDNTAEIIRHYQNKCDKMKSVELKGEGLACACNAGIKMAVGEYIIRLDADDYFDENILMIESNILDNRPEIGMVYPDYYRINQYGEIIEHVRLPRVNDEIKLLDRSPLAAGAMFRKACYEKIGGYNEELKYQEDYDFWIRFIEKFNVYNVNLPLMYYRRHDSNMSRNFDRRMKARQYVKKKFVDENRARGEKQIMAVIPAMGLFRNREKLALKPLRGKPLIAYTIEEALKTKLINRVIVSTEDQQIAEVATQFGAEVPFLRPLSLAKANVPVEEVIRHLVGVLRDQQDEVPEIIVVLHYYSPFKKESHITEAIDTILLYDTDSVISVIMDLTFHWKQGENGLIPVGYQKRLLREDKETVYKETGSLYVLKTKNLDSGDYLGKSVGFIEMSERECWRVDTDFDFWIAEQIMANEAKE